MIGGRPRALEAQVRVVAAIAALLVFAQAPVAGQTPDTKDGAGTATLAPDSAQLEELLGSKDYPRLARALSSTPLNRRLDWLKDRVLGGGTVFLALHYIDALWVAGVQAGEANPGKDMRVTAGLFELYAFQLMAIDGAKCEDSSAPGDRAVRLLTNFRPVNDYLRKQPIETRIKVVDLAMKMERFTAPKRKDDDWLCRGGLAEMAASRAAGVKPLEAPPTEGIKTLILPPAPGWSPKFLPSEKYAPLQEKVRASMREDLLVMVSAAEVPAWGRLPTPGDITSTPTPGGGANNEKLDELLNAKTYVNLDRELSRLPVDRRAGWLKDRLLDGGTAYLAFLYFNELWGGGVVRDEGDPDKDMRITAAVIALYTYQLLLIDGAKCEEKSSPGEGMLRLLPNLRQVVAHLQKQTMETKIKVVDHALWMEQFTAQKRQDDEYICGGSYASVLRAEAARRPEKPRTLLGPRELPKFRSSEQYAPLQEKARASMRELLLQWVLPAEDPAWRRLPTPDDIARKMARSPVAKNETLDELLRAKSYWALDTELAFTPTDRRMDWLKDRLLDGGTAFLAFRYVNGLWARGYRDKDASDTAGVIALYTYQLILIDGAKCEDQSARDRHMRELRHVVADLKRQPMETRIKAVDLALRMEQATAQKRQDDGWLCLVRGPRPPLGPIWTFLPREKYAPLQEKARASMREHLLELLKRR